MYAAGLQESESVVCTVCHCLLFYGDFFFSLTSLQGKIKRTKGFYIDDFKYLKTLVSPEVLIINLAPVLDPLAGKPIDFAFHRM